MIIDARTSIEPFRIKLLSVVYYFVVHVSSVDGAVCSVAYVKIGTVE